MIFNILKLYLWRLLFEIFYLYLILIKCFRSMLEMMKMTYLLNVHQKNDLIKRLREKLNAQLMNINVQKKF